MTPQHALLWAGAAALLGVLGTGLARRYALRRLMDQPNERSSHQVATPRGGGLAMALVFIAILPVAWLTNQIAGTLAIAMGLCGGIVAAVGFWDDHASLSAKVRLIIHFIGAGTLLVWIGGVPVIPFGSKVLELGGIGFAVGAFLIVWHINLVNFMDGIDGLAASQAVFVAGTGCAVAFGYGDYDVVILAAVLCGASLGFLCWNWPPAKIFMGDVGSGFLGAMIGGLMWYNAVKHPGALWCWLILNTAFIGDATYTLLFRLFTGQRWMDAHRSHVYQHLAGWHGHFNVTMGLWGVNIFFFGPLAYMAWLRPDRGWWLLGTALIPMVALCAIVGAGKKVPNGS
jgi:Fuc2NAc and GlcNAc transferase